MQGQKELAKSAKEREPATATASKNKKIESQNEVEKAAKGCDSFMGMVRGHIYMLKHALDGVVEKKVTRDWQ